MGSVYDWSKAAAANATADAQINWQEQQAPGTVNDSARQMMARLAELRDDLGGINTGGAVNTTGGAANAYTLTANSLWTTFGAGRIVSCRLHAASTGGGAKTLNVNATGNKDILTLDGAALPPLATGTQLLLLSDTVGWRALGVSSQDSAALSGTVTALETTVSALVAGSAGASTRNNLLINSDFGVNQRNYQGAALAGAAYGHDRWRGYNGITYSVSASGVVSVTTGILCQIIEPALWGLETLASTMLTVSVDTPSHDLTVSVGGAVATITAGSGRRSATLTTGAGDTGNLLFTIGRQGSLPFTMRRPSVEIGAAMGPWVPRSLPEEMQLCQRYFRRFGGLPGAGHYQTILPAVFWNTTIGGLVLPLMPRMRAVPSLTYPFPGSILCGNVSSSVAVSAMSLSGGVNNTVDCVEIGLTLASAVAAADAGRPARISAANSPNGYFDLSAEL